MRAAAELARVLLDLDDPNLVAVLLAEEHHRAELARLLERRDVCADGQVLEDLLVHPLLDPLALLGRERLAVREVEAKLVGANSGAGLLRVLAEHLVERLVQEVGARMVRHRRVADRPRHDRANARALAEPFPSEGENLVVPDPGRADQVGAHARLVVLDEASVGDLSPTLRVERRLLELRVEGAVASIFVGEDGREDVGALVPDELAARSLEQRGGDLERAADARDLTMLRHGPAVAVDVDRLAALLRELYGQLEREPVGGGERERRLARDRVPVRERLELAQATL